MVSRYAVSSRPRTPAAPRPLPAIWRGIGCLMMIVIPLASWMLARITVQAAVDRNWPLPYQLAGYPVMPSALWQVTDLGPVLAYIQGQQNLYAIIALCIIYIIVIGGLISAVYSITYGIVGPPKYGPLDAPPPRVRVGRYKR